MHACLCMFMFFSYHLKVTYADFALSMLIGGLIVHVDVAAVVARFPKVLALQQEVEKLPNIKAWLHRRQFTEY